MRSNENTVGYIWLDYSNFTEKWLHRAEDLNRPLDKADGFIALWVAFNAWMRKEFGEEKKDWELINDTKKSENIEAVYEHLRDSNEQLKSALRELSEYWVINMRFINDRSKDVKYDGTYKSLIDTLYQIRCNLFHGRKGTQETEEDYKLICLAYDILFPIIKEYILTHGC